MPTAMLPSPKRPPVLAAGCIVWRLQAGRLEVLMVHRPRYDDWSWPKGKLDPGEALVVCALRETVEETGHQVVLGVRLPTVTYHLRSGRAKEVHYWAARVAGGADAPAVRARPAMTRASGREIDQVRWVKAGRARRKLTRPKDRAPLDELAARFRAGTLATRPLVILRHAAAVPRSQWPSAEAPLPLESATKQLTSAEVTRPLTEAGQSRLAGLTPLLAAFGINKILTSPWIRCRQTVRPYRKAAGLRQNQLQALTETAAAVDPAAAAAIATEAVAANAASLICTHRPVLPPLFEAIAQACIHSPALHHRIPNQDPRLHTGEFLIAHIARRGPWQNKIVAIDIHRP